ncbi:MAG: diguanylate cyclase [Butyrivibrio sp.]|nr:diguanylate cyclase [Butyrivibrio sp.]
MKYNIVAVGDESTTLETVRALMTEGEMGVTCLGSGQMLLDYVKRNTPDLILMDVNMPEIDGFDTYIALRRYEDHEERTHIPVIFTSDILNAETEEYALVLGASDFIMKPFEKFVLIRRINNAIKNNRRIEDLTEEATVDRLTGFWNKAKGTDRVSKLCKRKKGALLILDLDSFKLVNDLYGHDKGDQILKAFADVVRHNTRETDTFCRIGGDEFLGFLDDLTDTSVLESLSLRLNSQLVTKAKSILCEDFGIPLGISMGVVMVPDEGTEYDDLFNMADNALYKVKQNGKHGYKIYGKEKIVGSQSGEGLLDKLDRIKQTLEERNDLNGTMILGKDSFSVVYRFVMRYYRRYGGHATLMLFELGATENDDVQIMIEALDSFNSILERILRKSDIVMQSDPKSFFVMLTECDEAEIENVIKRITESFKKSEYSYKVKVDHVYRYMERSES